MGASVLKLLGERMAKHKITNNGATLTGHIRSVMVGVVLCVAAPAVAQTELAAAGDFGDLSLDDLLEIEVVTVSRAAEPIGKAAAAIHVITADMIRQAGARTIAEALRLAPGVHVARSNAQTYSISIRGFASTSSDKLEVLIDGRSAYTPLFSGVFWESFDTYLPDIERIEIVRGPGATLWGANAVNGVINIVTKSAVDTVGSDVAMAAGTELRGFASMRTGQTLGPGAIRMYAKAYERDASEQASGGEALDGQRFSQAGLRGDWTLSSGHKLTLIGDVFGVRGTAADPITGDRVESDADGGNLNLRWSRTTTTGSTFSAAVYGESTRRRTPNLFVEDRETVDVNMQFNRAFAGGRHDLVAGVGYRRSEDETGAPPDIVIFDPQDRTVEQFNVFVMDKITLSDAATLSIGSKFEHNDFTGNEVQPGVRFGYELSEKSFTWASVSRAVRTPNRLDQDVAIFCPPPTGFPGVCAPGRFRIGNPDFDSETVLAYEAGWRKRVGSRASLDLSLFFNDYDDLRSTETQPPPFGSFENRLSGTGVGGELALVTELPRGWDVRAWYAHLSLDIEADPGSTDTTTPSDLETSSPEHQVGMTTRWSDQSNWVAHLALRYVSSLKASDTPAYTEADFTLIRKLGSKAELRLIGRNLLDDGHREFGEPSATAGTLLERSAALEFGLRW